MHDLKVDKRYTIDDWDLEVGEYKNNRFISFHDIPTQFEIVVKDKKILEELQNHIYFIDSKVIVSRYVYKFPEQQYLFSKNTLISPINSMYSYENTISDYSLQEIFTSVKYVKSLLKNLTSSEFDKYEIYVIQRFCTNLAKSSRSSYFTSVWEKQFYAMYGINSCISTGVEEDKKAIYYGYKVIKLHPQLEEVFKLLDICLSKHKKGSKTTHSDFIEKPFENTWDAYKDNSYSKVIECMVVLQKMLEEVYMLWQKNNFDTKHTFLSSLLPNYYRNKITSTEGQYLSESNYQRVIQDYCFKVYNKTHFVKSFSKEETLGLASDSILLKDTEQIMGTFFHEYIHVSTGLKDIDTEFEKMLSFVGIMGSKIKNNVTEKDLIKFLKNYNKIIVK
jgi:hypothetical protein